MTKSESVFLNSLVRILLFLKTYKKMDLRGNNRTIDSCDFYNRDLSVKLLIWKFFHMGHMEQKSQQYG